MTNFIGENYTRYATEDLEELAAIAYEAWQSRPGKPGSHNTRNAFHDITPFKVEYWTESNNFASSVGLERHVSSGTYVQDINDRGGGSRKSGSIMRLASPELILEHMNTLERLACVKEQEEWQMSGDFSADIVNAFIARARYTYAYHWRYVNIGVVPQPELLPRVRVRDQAQDKKRRRRLTKEQRIERYQRLYGEGGELEGPQWAWRSGQRAPKEKWDYRIRDAQEYYEREREARNKYREKLEELGADPKPYQTYAEYLRTVADRLEGKE